MIKNSVLSGSIFVAVVFALLSLAGCGSDNDSNVSNKVLVGDGVTLYLYNVEEDGSLVELSSADVPDPTPDHEIYGIVKYPTQSWIYVTSMVDYSTGNGRVDRFVLSDDTLTYDGAAFIYQENVGPTCVGDNCVPTTLAFNSDGSRAYIDEDGNDVLDIFSVDASGDFTFIWEGAETNQNGLIVSPDDDKVYNGESVLDLDDDTATTIIDGTEGNANAIVVDGSGTSFMTAVLNSTELAIYGLTDQAAPDVIDNITVDEASYDLEFGGGPAMYQDSSSDLSVFTVVGVESVATFSFDGTAFTLLDQYFNGNADSSVTPQVMNRGVAMTASGEQAVVAWFRPRDENGDELFDGGITVYSIDPTDGTLTGQETTTSTSPLRAVLAL